MLRPIVVRRIMLWSIEIFMAGMMLALVILAARILYRLDFRTRLLTIELQQEIKTREIKDNALREELDQIYRTLYAPPDTKNRQQSQVELWQLNRDRELRQRIQRLERWRYESER